MVSSGLCLDFLNFADFAVYFFRWIFHNYSRPWATKILKQIVPALKSGSRVIINDYCVGKSGSEKPEDERVLRGMDLVMGALLNSQERSEEEYRELFKLTDPRFSFIVCSPAVRR